jgi:DNA-binding transcriptional LysR family regulator
MHFSGPTRTHVSTNIDLRLLEVVSELERTRSVSRAAEKLNLSQSAVSMSLARLRKQFGDPLFVRTSGGMVPTPYALDLMGELKKASDILQAALDRRVVFDPETSDRTFRICSTDIAQFTLLPPLMTKLRKLAPHVRIDLLNITPDTSQLLESGEANLAIGLLPQMRAGFCQQRLFQGRFVCAMRKDHPRIKNELSRTQFENETHLAVTTAGTGYQMLEKTMDVLGIQRKVGISVPSFLGVPGIITVTDFLAIISERLGSILAEGKNVKLLPLPFEVPRFTVTQNWHERYSLDPASQWLRSVVASLFKENMADDFRPRPALRAVNR